MQGAWRNIRNAPDDAAVAFCVACKRFHAIYARAEDISADSAPGARMRGPAAAPAVRPSDAEGRAIRVFHSAKGDCAIETGSDVLRHGLNWGRRLLRRQDFHFRPRETCLRIAPLSIRLS